MTTFPASGPAGTLWKARSGMVTTTSSPPSAASCPVAARASGPSSAARSFSVSGPRELLSSAWWPAATASRARVPPMWPLPISPTVVRDPLPPGGWRSFQRPEQRLHPRAEVGRRPGGDQVAVDDCGLVPPVDAGVDHVVADRRNAGRPPAFDDLRGNRHPSGMADERDRLPRVVERPHPAEHARRAPP